MANPVVHFEIMGRPGAQLPDFYRSLFDWPVTIGEPVNTYAQHSAIPPQDGQGIGGGIGATDDDRCFVTVYVEVDDLEHACASAQALGGQVVFPPTLIPEIRDLRIAGIVDPQGNTIGLAQRR
jgi:predicted enzyme related to lactoylglutathione lyase